MNCSSCFWIIVGEELFRIFRFGRTHWPLKISTVWKCSNSGPGGFGGGRIVNRGGGGRRRKLSFFICKSNIHTHFTDSWLGKYAKN